MCDYDDRKRERESYAYRKPQTLQEAFEVLDRVRLSPMRLPRHSMNVHVRELDANHALLVAGMVFPSGPFIPGFPPVTVGVGFVARLDIRAGQWTAYHGAGSGQQEEVAVQQIASGGIKMHRDLATFIFADTIEALFPAIDWRWRD